ncbi:MAG: type IV secretion system protein [Pseudomonadota bacterium]
MFKRLVIIAASTALIGSTSFAKVPTKDEDAILQMIEQIKTAEEQLTMMKDQLANMSGFTDLNLDLPEFDVDILDLDLNGLVDDFISGIGSNFPNDSFDDLQGAFAFDGLEEFTNSENAIDRSIGQNAGEAAASYALSVAGIDAGQTMVERSEQLMSDVGGQEEMKDAIDYGNALMAENLANQGMLMKVLSAQLKSSSVERLSNAHDQYLTRTSGRIKE